MTKLLQKQLKNLFFTALLCPALLLSACGGTAAAAAESAASAPAESLQSLDTQAFFSARDLDPSYDEAAAIPIQLTGSTALCSSDAVSVSGGQITLSEEGVYLLSGTLEDGQILVNATDSDKVQIVLSGADITSASSAAIYCKQADKLFVTLAEGTENRLANGGSFTPVDDSNIDAVIFSKNDLTLNGEGSLAVDSPAGHGVVSKDELTITGGSYTLTAAKSGFTGKDSVAIASGSFHITAGKDGIHSDAALLICSGSFTIPDCYEGLEGLTVTIEGGSLDITSRDDGINAASGDNAETARGFAPQDPFAVDEGCAITINGGSITIVSDGDCIDSNGSLTVNGGSLKLTCNGNGNTAIDVNGTFSNNGGSITTNDGSESGTGGHGGRLPMGGGHGGMAGEKPFGGRMPPENAPQEPETDPPELAAGATL
ncbi:MAG: carbohydrate-binding domain-containing protein [Candidatus Limivicinus sp.]